MFKVRREEFGVWVAQGCGVGRIPWAPGTFGSIIGMLWTGVLLASGSIWVFVGLCFLGLMASVSLCTRAELSLGQKDPASVVIDEVTAMPLCFLPWLLSVLASGQAIPNVANWISVWNGGLCLGGFFLFRLFDIWKPWPIRQSQQLPAGWGVTIDDILAALYASIPLLVIELAR